jgi:4-alpha-glucanotransferase
MVVWWEAAPRAEREAVLAIPSMRRHLTEEEARRAIEGGELPHAVHEALIETLYASGSDLLILPLQDLFGWRDRINQPATVGDSNWTWRLPWPTDRLRSEAPAMLLAEQMKAWSTRHGR